MSRIWPNHIGFYCLKQFELPLMIKDYSQIYPVDPVPVGKRFSQYPKDGVISASFEFRLKKCFVWRYDIVRCPLVAEVGRLS